ncbi:UbiA family prenyltransferase [Synechococcus sp. BA-120 BA3]|nr:UbiA family prenyltransferase [Synechococcus sp. BA-120 BA3]
MSEPQVVASRYAAGGGAASGASSRGRLWRAAVKWPMYAVAVMPVLLAAGWRLGQGLGLRPEQLLLFLLAAVLLLAWENLANDVFDADTGVDTHGKPHSVVNLTGRRDRVLALANGCLVVGLALMALVALRSSPVVLLLVLLCCGLGYLYQGPPFRLGYRGLGEPLCWLAFGPCATAAALLALAPAGAGAGHSSTTPIPRARISRAASTGKLQASGRCTSKDSNKHGFAGPCGWLTARILGASMSDSGLHRSTSTHSLARSAAAHERRTARLSQRRRNATRIRSEKA